MQLGLHYWSFNTPADPALIAPTLADTARAAEQAGVASFSVMDHYFQMEVAGGSADEPMLEGYTALGYVAALTERMSLGLLVTGVMYRHPGLLAKIVTTLDVLSGGRAWLGIGAGYQQREADAMGLFLPPVPERFIRLEETLRLAAQMWTGDPAPFIGRDLQLAEPISNPRPVSAPRPKILIGGTGPKRTLRLVAEYADAANFFDIPDGGTALRANLAILAEHCTDVGRDPDDIEHTVTTALMPDETASQLADRCLALNERGMDHVVLIPRGRPWLLSDAELLGNTVTIIAP